MRFKDAAFKILQQVGKPLHYAEIADRALAAGLLETVGATPRATMGALLYTDTLNPDSRFRRGDEKGTFTLKSPPPTSIQQQIEAIQIQVRKDLRQHLLKMPPQKFEELIRLLLEEMGFEETETTPYHNDKGVDVRGVLRANQLSTVKIAIQAKRWTGNVGSGVIRDLRGSLKVADAEQGLVITPSDFASGAKDEAQAVGKTPISLINGEQLVDLLIRYQVGVKQEQYSVPSIDAEYWTEVLGVTLANDTPAQKVGEPTRSTPQLAFPIPIRAKHHDQEYTAELLNRTGVVRLNGQEYPTPTTAAKTLITDWKEVNGWDFWRYLDPKSGKWGKIGTLRTKEGN